MIYLRYHHIENIGRPLEPTEKVAKEVCKEEA